MPLVRPLRPRDPPNSNSLRGKGAGASEGLGGARRGPDLPCRAPEQPVSGG